MQSGPSQYRNLWPPEAWAAFLGGAAATAAAWKAAGVSLGPVIGGFVAGAILLPPMLAGRKTGRYRIVMACIAGIAAMWPGLVGPMRATFGQYLALLGMLGTFFALLAAMVVGLERLAFPAVLSSGLTVVLAISWLTWPVWLSPILLGGWLQPMVNVQPILAANGLLRFTSPWTEQAIAYRLTTLDQDVPIALPVSAWACIAFHGGIGLGIGVIASLRKRPPGGDAKPTDQQSAV